MPNDVSQILRNLGVLSRLRVKVTDRVAIVTLDAPPVNAQNRAMREELVRTFDVLGASEDVRAIVLTGAGSVFCAGADLGERGAIGEEPGGYARHNRLVCAMLEAVADCPKPVIAAVNGAAIGGGCVLALVCDILLVAETAFFAMTEVDYGLAGGVSHALRAFSPSDARLLIYTARRFSGPELVRMNVASQCHPLDHLLPAAMAIAHEIADKMPLAIAAAKRSFALAENLPLRDGYRHEQGQTAALAASDDARELRAARAEKRQPIFSGR